MSESEKWIKPDGWININAQSMGDLPISDFVSKKVEGRPTVMTPEENYIDLSDIYLYHEHNNKLISMTKMRSYIDLYESCGFPKGVNGILMTQTQYDNYADTLLLGATYSFNCSDYKRPDRLMFDGITIKIK